METQPNATPAGFRPPYLAFQTFWSFLEKLCEKPLPPAIDRSLMDGKSGSDQVQLFAALRSFALINDEKEVLPPLTKWAAEDDAGRVVMLRDWVMEYYAEPMRVSASNGTEAQLNSSFTDAFKMTSADTKRKSMTFFLHAARKAGIELSPHFPATRSGSGGPSTPRPKKAKAAKRIPPPPNTQTPRENGAGDSYQVTLMGGGTVTVVVSESHFNLSKNRSDRDFVNALVDAMVDYAADHDQEVASAEGGT